MIDHSDHAVFKYLRKCRKNCFNVLSKMKRKAVSEIPDVPATYAAKTRYDKSAAYETDTFISSIVEVFVYACESKADFSFEKLLTRSEEDEE